jgi:hypothetical protein
LKQNNSLTRWLVIFLSLIFTLPGFSTPGQNFQEAVLNNTLPDKIGKEWKASAPTQKVGVAQLSTSPDIQLLLEYGWQGITHRQYTNGKDKFLLESFEMKYPSGAYGLWTLHRQSLPNGKKEFFHDRYLVRISASDATIADAITAELQTNLAPTADLPLLPTYLPEQNKLAASEKYLVGPTAFSQLPALSDLKDVIDFTAGTHAAMAEYSNGGGKMSVLLIEFQSPQFATDGLQKIQQHFNALPPEEQKKRILRRVGNYAVEAVNVADTKAAEELLGQIKYMARVHWEGKGIASIPLQFRPPDPIALQETLQTGRFIVATFYWIGVLVLGAIFTGIFAGGAFFYWRRAQRRKGGMEDAFSDAGGMTRLNLDDYLLLEPGTAQKLLGKKE